MCQNLNAEDFQEMGESFRKIRNAVWALATTGDGVSAEQQIINQYKLRSKIQTICNDADLSKYTSNHESKEIVLGDIWKHLWRKNRYAGIKAQTASNEIESIEVIFDNFRVFSEKEWDINVTHGRRPELAEGTGSAVFDFVNREGQFRDRNTVGKISKLKVLIKIARAMEAFASDPRKSNALEFITGPYGYQDVWSVQNYLMNGLGYRADLTALHFMMDMGFPVIKPDIVITRVFLKLGWLHRIIPGLPEDLGALDLRGNGNYGNRFVYTKPLMYRPIIELAIAVTESLDSDDLRTDIGWVTSNLVREFDLFMVKIGQEPEHQFGIETNLFSRLEEIVNAD